MKPILFLFAGALCGGALLFAGPQEARPAEAQAGPSQEDAARPTGFDPAVMEKMVALATPGEEHAELAKHVGSWDISYKMRMAPDAEWMEIEGTSEAREILGGRYVLEEIDMNVMGMPTQGIQILGYDKMADEYTALWMDTFSTWWIQSSGNREDDGKIVLTGTMRDVAGERPFRQVILPKDDDSYAFEMYDTIPPHGEVLVMQGAAVRAE